MSELSRAHRESVMAFQFRLQEAKQDLERYGEYASELRRKKAEALAEFVEQVMITDTEKKITELQAAIATINDTYRGICIEISE